MFIELTYNNYSKSNGRKFNLRADLVERIATSNDGRGSVITLQGGSNWYSVKESKDAVSLLVTMALGRYASY